MAITTIIEKQEIAATVGNTDFQLPVFGVGYSLRGDENTNVYFSNYAEFKRKFGNAPYYFKHAQEKNSVFFQAQGSIEKGFVYMHEYALSNKPGVFRRITKPDAPYCQLFPDVQIMTKVLVGNRSYSDKQIIIEDVLFSKIPITAGKYLYTANVATLTNAAFGATTYNDDTTPQRLFNVKLGSVYFSSNYTSNGTLTADDSGYITLETTSNITTLSGQVSFISKATQIEITHKADGTVVLVDGNAVTDIPVDDNGTELIAHLPWGLETFVTTEYSQDTGKTLRIKASSSGAWGTNIKVTIERIPQSNKLIIKAVYNDGEETESILGSLVFNSDDFIAGSDGEQVTTLLKIQNGDSNDAHKLDGSEDSSMLFVNNLSSTALSYTGNPVADEITVQDIYDAMNDSSFWTDLQDKDLNDYAIHTTSAYPLYDATDSNALAPNQLQAVANYQLGFAVIDPRKRPQGQSASSEIDLLLNPNSNMPLESLVSGLNSNGEKNEIYGTMFFDWRAYPTTFGRVELPPSFAYITALSATGMSANQIKPWEALANDYGTVSISDNAKLGAALSDRLQRNNEPVGIRINPIQYLKDAGNRIMGNSTLVNNQGELTNYSFLNIRLLTTLVKRYAYKLGNTLKYKTNDLNTFLTFQSKMTVFMNKLLDKGLRTEDSTGKRIVPFGIERLPSTEKSKIRINIWYYPLEAIEIIEETVSLKDGYVQIGD